MAEKALTTRRTLIKAFPFIGAAAAVSIGVVAVPVAAVDKKVDAISESDRNLLRFLREASPQSLISYHKMQLGLALAAKTGCGWVATEFPGGGNDVLLFAEHPGTPEGIGLHRAEAV